MQGPLYLLYILHQTTTVAISFAEGVMLYLLYILHQTTTMLDPSTSVHRCISCISYIKPQQIFGVIKYYTVVSLVYPTSNHNRLLKIFLQW